MRATSVAVHNVCVLLGPLVDEKILHELDGDIHRNDDHTLLGTATMLHRCTV